MSEKKGTPEEMDAAQQLLYLASELYLDYIAPDGEDEEFQEAIGQQFLEIAEQLGGNGQDFDFEIPLIVKSKRTGKRFTLTLTIESDSI